jgi:hypothetical protein
MANETTDDSLPCDTAQSAEVSEAEQNRLNLEESLRIKIYGDIQK